jgi:hypothetical protein
VAGEAGLDVEVVAVVLVTDDTRVEVFRVGEPVDGTAWGDRRQ